jgi:hypothetical protein
MKNFVEREYQEVEGGYLGEDGFYYTPNGSKIKKNNLNRKAFGTPITFISIKKDMTSMVIKNYLNIS